MVDQLGVLKIHYPLDRKATKVLRADCHRLVEKRVEVLKLLGITTVLLTDHNTHGGLPSWGGRRLMGRGIDYIGAAESSHIDGATLKVLKWKVVDGTIDNHNFIGVQVRVTWASGLHTKIWFVQANLGRHETQAKFFANARRLKKAFSGNVVWGFDEIDEADGPNEHALLKKVWDPKRYHHCGGSTFSPVIVSPRLRVRGVVVRKACDGLEHVTPHRDLVEVIIERPHRLSDRFKK